MVPTVLRALWAEPRPASPPARNSRDWLLVAALTVWSVAEAVLRDDLAPLPLVLAAAVAAVVPLLWRRTRPLATVAAAFGILTAVDVVRILATVQGDLPTSVVAVLVVVYALFRWGSGRDTAIGLGIILISLVVSHLADPTALWEIVAGYAIFLFTATLGTAIRYRARTRVREIDEAKAREREQLARELHDTVAHHVSGIAIQAQAGRAVAASAPERAVGALVAIEDAATRTLSELRTMVGVLRASHDTQFAPQPAVADLQRLGGGLDERPHVHVTLSGELEDLSPAVGAAIYRLAQESITNAIRHARHATRVDVVVVGDADGLRLTVDDDGAPGTARGGGAAGYGLVGMQERATLLGGTFQAGPTADGGWRVEATLPRTWRAA